MVLFFPLIVTVAAVFAAALAIIYTLSPKKDVLTLKQVPTVPWIAAQAIYTSLLKPSRKPSTVAIQGLHALQVTMAGGQKFQAQRLQRFIQITKHQVSTGGYIPLMYPIAESFRLCIQAMLLPGFPFKILGSVLARNTTRVSRPIAVNEVLTYSVRISPDAWRMSQKGDVEVDILTEATSQGSVVWSSTTTAIILNPRRARGKTASTEQGATQDQPAGQPNVIDTWRLPADTGLQFGLISGDLFLDQRKCYLVLLPRNPIHLHAATSQLFGFKRPIAHALYLVSRAEASLRAQGITPGYPAVYTTEFKRPTLLPATLKLALKNAAPATELKAGSQPVEFVVLTDDLKKEVLTGKLSVAAS